MLPDTNGFMVDLGGALLLHVLPEAGTLRNQLRRRRKPHYDYVISVRLTRPNARGIAAALVALPWRAVLDV